MNSNNRIFIIIKFIGFIKKRRVKKTIIEQDDDIDISLSYFEFDQRITISEKIDKLNNLSDEF